MNECVENPAQHDYSKASCQRTVRWLARCQAEMARLKAEGKAVNPHQLLFGINQGCTFPDLRVEHMKQIAEMELDGYAIGGLAVGGARRSDVRHHQPGRAPYAPGQGALSDGGGHPGQYHRGGGPGAWICLTASCPAATPATAT